MTSPLNSSQNAQGQRIYTWPLTGEQFSSVTTILDVINKPALKQWAANQAATYVIENFNEVHKTLMKDRTEAHDLIKFAHKRYTDTASDMGTHAHACVEAYIRGEDIPEPIPPHMDHFYAWCKEYEPKFVECESTVYNRAVGYAGTMDLIAIIDGARTIVDIKTGKNVWPEAALQLAAYSRGEFIGRQEVAGETGGTQHYEYIEEPMQEVQRAAVLHLRMTQYKYIPCRIDDEVFRAFRYVNEVFRWQQYISKTVLAEK